MKRNRWLVIALVFTMLLPQALLVLGANEEKLIEPVVPNERLESGLVPEGGMEMVLPNQEESLESLEMQEKDPDIEKEEALDKGEKEPLGNSEEQEGMQIPAANSVGVMPGIKEIIYENGFSDSANFNNITSTPGDGTVDISDGTLNLTHTGNANWTGADIYVKQDKATTISGTVGVEFTLKRDSVKPVQIRFRTGGTSDYVALTWNGGKTVSSIHSDSYGTDGSAHTVSYTSGNDQELKVQVYLDTSKSQFSMWLNEEPVLNNVYARVAGSNKLMYIRLYLESTNYTTLHVDDFKIFYADPPAEDAIAADLEWLTDARIMTGAYVMDNVIMDSLLLPTVGNYGCDITWESSNPELISIEEGENGNFNGIVTRPASTTNPEVTVTAHLSKGGLEATKEFTFKILRILNSDQEKVEAEIADLTADPWNHEPHDAVITSLDLRTEGLYGTTISWSSNNPNVISESGLVTRPRSDKQNETVTMTATVTSGGVTMQRQFEYTVLKDEEYTDPDWISDEDFFGVWNGARWINKGKFDYSISGLNGVETAVKEGDYAKAKEELLTYMKTRNQASPVAGASRNSGWANMCISGIYNLQGNAYYDGDGVVTSNDYQQISVPVTKGHIAKGGETTYSIIARNNELSTMLIAGTNYSDAIMRPKIELVVNGQTRTYDAVKSAMIRAGNYKDSNYGTEEELKVKIFGEFLGDETYRALINFDFSDLTDSDNVSSARLILYAKVEEQFVSQKSFIVNFEPTNTWDPGTVVWNTLTGYVYNYNGIPGGCTWDAVPGCDAEYTYQVPRFLAWRGLATEYEYTGDEKYAYFMIRDMMDFIWDKGGPYAYGGSGQWPSSGTIGMGWPRTLDTASRLEYWIGSWNAIVKSPYMTGETCSAILKEFGRCAIIFQNHV